MVGAPCSKEAVKPRFCVASDIVVILKSAQF